MKTGNNILSPVATAELIKTVENIDHADKANSAFQRWQNLSLSVLNICQSHRAVPYQGSRHTRLSLLPRFGS